MNHSQIVSFIWGVADLIRDTFKRGKYQDVILPLTVLRRLDCVLAPTKRKVLAVQARFKGKLDNLDPQLRRASGFAFYNTSRYDFEKLLADAPHVAQNLRNYIAGFSPNMREVLEMFDFDNTISKLDEAGLLFQVVQRFGDPKVDLHPDAVDNAAMGTIFEELIRKFNEALNENPGEHFTPRDVVHLMVDLLLAGDRRRLRTKGVVLSVYDPCCGSGGMLTIAKEHVTAGETRGGEPCAPAVNPGADVHLFGQEVNPETFAICKSDLFMKSADGRDAENVVFGSTLSNDRHAGAGFDYMIANPPYGKDWKRDQDAVRDEHDRGAAGRFGPGLPRISDGQLLFLLHMLAHVRGRAEGGSRVAIIMNGSPLFTGDAGSGESEIRRWILENDLLEALIALPEQLFYNTGIATYVWVLTNRKRPARRGRVQLVDATAFWTLLRKSLGAKRREVPFERKQDILQLLADFEDGATRRVDRDGEERDAVVSRVYPTTHFGFRKITVERPLRLDFQASPERIARLDDERAFANLAVSRKRGRGRGQGRGGGPRAAGRDPGHARQPAGRALPRPGGLRRRALPRRRGRRPEARRAPPQGDSLGPVRAQPRGRGLPRPRRPPRARPRAARHRERAPRRGRRVVLRPRGQAPRPRRLDRHGTPRPPGRRGRARGLRDQLQPLLLRVPPAPPARGDRGGHPAGREGDRGHAAGDVRLMADTSLTSSRTVDAAAEEVGVEEEQGRSGADSDRRLSVLCYGEEAYCSLVTSKAALVHRTFVLLLTRTCSSMGEVARSNCRPSSRLRRRISASVDSGESTSSQSSRHSPSRTLHSRFVEFNTAILVA